MHCERNIRNEVAENEASKRISKEKNENDKKFVTINTFRLYYNMVGICSAQTCVGIASVARMFEDGKSRSNVIALFLFDNKYI